MAMAARGGGAAVAAARGVRGGPGRARRRPAAAAAARERGGAGGGVGRRLALLGGAGAALLRERRARADEVALDVPEAVGDGMAEVGAGVEGALEGAADGSAAASAADAAMDDFFADERVLLEYNRARRMQALNGAPADFPTFLRDGFEATVVTPPETDYVVGSDGLLTLDFELGTGRAPGPTDEVVFEYKVYNEAGKLIDGTYNKETPGQTRLGLGGLIPGVEEGMLGMRVGGRRRIVCPPELGPPVGPQTFFMSRQYEVFDVKLLEVHTCTEKQVLFTKRSVCE